MDMRERLPSGVDPGEGDPSPPEGLWIALVLDGTGGAHELDWGDLERAQEGQLWIHLDPRVARARNWLRDKSGLSIPETERLLHEEPRPRLESPRAGCFLVSLRGLAPELDVGSRDLSLIHMWLEPGRVISFSRRSLPGVEQARDLYRSNTGPLEIQDLFLWMTTRLGSALRSGAFDLEDEVTELEYRVEGAQEAPSAKLQELSTRVTRLHRHVAPFKILLERIIAIPDSWLVRDHKKKWSHLSDEASDTEALFQTLHVRARALHGYLTERLAARMNYILYILTIVSVILVPLTLITGLLGMNVGIRNGSVPFLETPLSFGIVCFTLVVLGWIEYRIIKKWRLL